MSNYLDWKVGDKVVCVDDAPAGSKLRPQRLLERGRIYTIAGVTTGYGERRGEYGLHVVVVLAEVRNIPHPWDVDGFAADRFRKVQPRKTDISIFTAMLTGAKERERA